MAVASTKGCFLEVNYLDIELVVPPQRILFPLGEPWPRPSEDQIYPIRKSRVEVLLDHYFEVERTIAGNTETDEMLDQLRKRGIYIPAATHLRPPRPFLEEFVIPSAIDALPRWQTAIFAAWLRPPREEWHEVQTDTEVLIYLPKEHSYEGMVVELKTFLAKNPGVRNRLSQFRFQDDGHAAPADRIAALEARVVRLWDGMRSLPYGDDQVAKAMARTIALELVIQRDNVWNGRGWYGVFGPVILDIRKVELGMPDGTGCAAFLPEPLFRSALRTNLKRVFRPVAASKFGDTRLLLQIITSPEILFCFGRLVELFAEYLIPTQILMRDFAEPVVFNSVTLMTFGAP
jgi:hypothetical protein